MRNERFPHLEKPGRARRPTLGRKRERLHDEPSTRPARPFTVAIRWVEIGELRLEVTVNGCTTRDTSLIRDSSATEQTSTPTAAAFSRARPRIRQNKPGDSISLAAEAFQSIIQQRMNHHQNQEKKDYGQTKTCKQQRRGHAR